MVDQDLSGLIVDELQALLDAAATAEMPLSIKAVRATTVRMEETVDLFAGSLDEGIDMMTTICKTREIFW